MERTNSIAALPVGLVLLRTLRSLVEARQNVAVSDGVANEAGQFEPGADERGEDDENGHDFDRVATAPIMSDAAAQTLVCKS